MRIWRASEERSPILTHCTLSWAGPPRRELRHQAHVVPGDGLLNRVRCRAGGDLELLLPELGLLLLDLAVQPVVLKTDLDALLAKLEQHRTGEQATEQAEDQFDHGGELSVVSRQVPVASMK